MKMHVENGEYLMENIDVKDENKLILTVCLVILGIFVNQVAIGVSAFLPVSQSVVTMTCKIMIIIPFVFSLPIIIKMFTRQLLVFAYGIILTIILQTLFFPECNVYFYSTLLDFITTIMPITLCMVTIKDYRSLYEKLRMVAYIISVIIIFLILFAGNKVFEQYSMGFSSSMMLPCCVLLSSLLDNIYNIKVRILCGMLFVIDLIAVLAYGSRGAVAVIALYCIYINIKKFIDDYRSMTKKEFIIKGIVIAFFICGLLFYRQILNYLYVFLIDKGVQSRSLNLFLNALDYDSGRNKLWEIIWENIKNEPFKIRGINADYLILGAYTHDIFLEVLYELGIVCGGVFLVIIIYKTLWTLKCHNDEYTKILVLMFFCSVPILIWSGSLWKNYFFWIWFLTANSQEYSFVMEYNRN